MEMALTGDPITANPSVELGLVNQLCEPGEVVATAGLSGAHSGQCPDRRA